MNFTDFLLICAALLYGGYEIVTGYRNSRLSGFPFYWIAGLLLGIPFFVLVVLLLLHPYFSSGLAEGSLIFVWLIG